MLSLGTFTLLSLRLKGVCDALPCAQCMCHKGPIFVYLFKPPRSSETQCRVHSPDNLLSMFLQTFFCLLSLCLRSCMLRTRLVRLTLCVERVFSARRSSLLCSSRLERRLALCSISCVSFPSSVAMRLVSTSTAAAPELASWRRPVGSSFCTTKIKPWFCCRCLWY